MVYIPKRRKQRLYGALRRELGKIFHELDKSQPSGCLLGGGNHSITAGILAGEGTLIPEHVWDMSFLFERINTDGLHWYVDGKKTEDVKSWRAAAIFETGRLMSSCPDDR
ncbi:DUF6710 family protein [Enterobacter bugandensis]|uniref:DUF6710 family protein n=1 Tax=Enterobacter bugandensis TaxID=881260 RepID=UPI00069D9696